MRGSFGGSYGIGRNGGGGGFNGDGGGGMRTVGRLLRTRINGLQQQDPFNSSSSKRSTTPPKTRNSTNNTSSKHGLSINNNTNTSVNGVISNSNIIPVWSVGVDDGEIIDDEIIDDDWECLDDYYNDPVFGVVPNTNEVHHAMFSLRQFLHPSSHSQSASEEIVSDIDQDMANPISSVTDVLQRTSSTASSQDWLEPSMQLYDQRLARSCGWEKVYDAFHLLQTEPSVQKMVVSLSSDKAVWDAVLNNETVREIRDSYLNAAEASPLNEDKNSHSNENSNVLKWIMDHMKGKLMEVVGNITQFVGGIFMPPTPDKPEESLVFSEKLKSSFLLTIVVLLIVVVTRGSKA